jgi:hypothetical protein
MRIFPSMKGFVSLLFAFLPLAHPAWSQSSTSIGIDSIDVSNEEGQVFDIGALEPLTLITVGESSGPDVDFRIKDPFFSVDENALYFNASTCDLTLGSGSGLENGADGDLILLDSLGVQTIRLSGENGGAAMQPAQGNGFVKAWVKVRGSDGARLSSYNVSAVERTGTGDYHLTLNPLSLNDRPIMATLDGHDDPPLPGGVSVGVQDGFHPGQKRVLTYDMDGNPADRSFTLVVY